MLEAALEAGRRAYCPYSGLAVGAAILSASGRIYTGCNVENASYSLTNCAERVALQSAVAAGEREFAAIAVVAPGDKPTRPCGACLQVLAEFSPAIRLILGTPDGLSEEHSLADLLPEPFRLPGNPPGQAGG